MWNRRTRGWGPARIFHIKPLVVAVTAVATALALVPAARAHVEFSPPFVTRGDNAQIGVAVPNEHPRTMVALELVAPTGVELLSAEAPAGWKSDVDSGRAGWSQGALAAGATATFRLRLRAEANPGTLVFQAVQRFDDGAEVPWQAKLTVLPAAAPPPAQHLGRALAAAVVGVGVIAGSLFVLRRMRRRSLQER